MNICPSALRAKQCKYFASLFFLSVLFCFRVIGQMLIALWNTPYLPPMQEWSSGVIPYPGLLACQISIILLCGKICFDFARGRGFFVAPRPILGKFLLQFGSIYLAIMIMRYVIRMALYPMERWTGGSIPIFFHCVLALFLLVLGRYHWSFKPDMQAAKGVSRLNIMVVCSAGLSLMAAVGTWIAYQVLPSYLANKHGVCPAQYAVRIQRHVSMSTSDAVQLVADVFHPNRLPKSPTILIRAPYSNSVKNLFYANIMGRIWAERGYTVVIQGSRGRGDSGGYYYPLVNERRDGIETLTWLSKQSWYNGQIATWGGSTFGYSQWAIADQVNPGPSVLHVYEASTDFYNMFYPGGAFSLATALGWAINSHGKVDMPNWPSADLINRSADGFPLVDADKRAIGCDVPFFKDWVCHTKRDSYWIGIDGINRAKSLKAPILLMAGWYDPFLPTQLNDYINVSHHATKKVADRSCLIIGPWTHAGEAKFPGGTVAEQFRPKSIAVSLPWFDSQLQSCQTQGQGRVKIFMMGKNVWRSEHEWPLPQACYTHVYLRGSGNANSINGDGLLSFLPPHSCEKADKYVYDPLNPIPTVGGAMFGSAAGIARQNDIELRPDVLVYSTNVLTKDIEITGPVCARLYVATSATNTDFTAKLVDVYPDGCAYNVCDGIVRLENLDCNAPNYATQPRQIKVDLWPTSIVFLKGHRIRLEISSSNFPRFDRNPNTGRFIPTETVSVIANQMVYHDSRHPSAVILPIIPTK